VGAAVKEGDAVEGLGLNVGDEVGVFTGAKVVGDLVGLLGFLDGVAVGLDGLDEAGLLVAGLLEGVREGDDGLIVDGRLDGASEALVSSSTVLPYQYSGVIEYKLIDKCSVRYDTKYY
jgi:hypothetical protein